MPSSDHDHDDDELKQKLRRAFGDQADEAIRPVPVDPTDDLMPPDTTELESRMRQAITQTQNFKEKRTQSADQLAKERKLDQASARGLGIGLQIAYTIIGLPLLGFGAGALLDLMTHANFWKGIIGMLGCILGVGIAIVLINRANAET